ncbi:MAG: hypothetical protein AB8G22_14055 [Saprospiraceae bacterium]
MKYLPYEKINFKTKLSSTEVLAKIETALEPRKMFRGSGFLKAEEHKFFQGEIRGNTFDMVRIINYRNSFLPQIKGVVSEENGSSVVTIKLKLTLFTTVFLCLFCGFLVTFLIAALFVTEQPDNSISTVFFALGMLLVVYLMTIIGFKVESKKVKEYFAKLIAAPTK